MIISIYSFYREKVGNNEDNSNMNRVNKGFRKTSNFLNQVARRSFEKRGFAQSQLITNWSEIIGLEFSAVSKPVKMTFPKSGLGATLTIEINGAFGPELEMQKNIIKSKVNRVYGYTAVSKLRFTSSSQLGYDNREKGSLTLKNNERKFDSEEVREQSNNLHDLLSKLDKIENKKLKSILSDYSKNFIKRV